MSWRVALPATKSVRPAIVIHCSDPRFQSAFQEFVRRELGVERYSLIAVPGGPQFLTLFEYLPKFAWAGWRWVKFLAGLSEADRAILIAHCDCRWYLDMRFAAVEELRERQMRDLRRVRQEWGERFGSTRVELYYATLQGDHVEFEAI